MKAIISTFNEHTYSCEDKSIEMKNNNFGIYHVYQNNGEHKDSESCFCNPYLEYKDLITKNEVWLHRENH